MVCVCVCVCAREREGSVNVRKGMEGQRVDGCKRQSEQEAAFIAHAWTVSDC